MAPTGLNSGRAFHFAGRTDIANLVWIAAIVPALAALVGEMLRSRAPGRSGWISLRR
jgi:hypothetical protein